jgi:hypothetical protein
VNTGNFRYAGQHRHHARASAKLLATHQDLAEKLMEIPSSEPKKKPDECAWAPEERWRAWRRPSRCRRRGLHDEGRPNLNSQFMFSSLRIRPSSTVR